MHLENDAIEMSKQITMVERSNTYWGYGARFVATFESATTDEIISAILSFNTTDVNNSWFATPIASSSTELRVIQLPSSARAIEATSTINIRISGDRPVVLKGLSSADPFIPFILVAVFIGNIFFFRSFLFALIIIVLFIAYIIYSAKKRRQFEDSFLAFLAEAFP